MGIQGRKKTEPKKPSVQGWVTGNKGCKLVLKKCVPPTTSGPEHKPPNSPCNTVIHWGIYYYHCILNKCFKSGGGKGHQMLNSSVKWRQFRLEVHCWGKDNHFKILSPTKKKILQKNVLLVSSQLGFKIH